MKTAEINIIVSTGSQTIRVNVNGNPVHEEPLILDGGKEDGLNKCKAVAFDHACRFAKTEVTINYF